MAVRIGSPLITARVIRNLNEKSAELSSIAERLSSGLRINSAKDDAAGIAIASTLRSKALVYGQSVRNLNDVISLTSVADGALQSLNYIGERLAELSAQAANGSYSTAQRSVLDTEAAVLVEEFNRIVQVAQFNGIKLLDGSNANLNLQAGPGSTMQVSLGSELERNAGTGTYTAIQTITPGGSTPTPTGTAVADFDGDGDEDFVTVNGGDFKLSFYANDGTGTFSLSSSINAGITSLDSAVAGDFNGDGAQDVFIFRRDATGDSRLMLNNGNGTFTLGQTISGMAATVGDYNTDGIDDIALVSGSYVNVYSGSLGGTFSLSSSVSSGTLKTGMQAGDFDGDGDADLVYEQVGILRMLTNNGGTFTSAGISIAGTYAGGNDSLAVGDIDDDGDDDVVGLGLVFMSDGAGSFSIQQTLADAGDRVSLHDANGDGYLDITQVGSSTNILLNDGSGSFTLSESSAASTNYFTYADLTGDGVIDRLSSSLVAFSPRVTVGRGNFTETTTMQNLNLTSIAGAQTAMQTVAELLARVQSEISAIGASASRVTFATTALQGMRDNFLAAESRITDADMAKETANYLKKTIELQAATALLAQANQQPALVLSLLGIK